MCVLQVVVPLSNINDWNNKYEKMTDMIVPRSSQLIYQDNDHALVSVTCFKKVVDEFKQVRNLKEWKDEIKLLLYRKPEKTGLT